MNGIIVIDKPKGKTSHDMVYFVRRLTGIKRVGHTGTLDPNATGVLPVCIGRATKASDYIMDSDKLYRAEIIFGAETDTQDNSGEVLHKSGLVISEGGFRNVLGGFIGEIKQVPPMYSAVKVDGKKLYELARQGRTIERKTRTVNIYDINIMEFNESGQTAIIEVSCSKGTYVRTLCNDIGERLGCFAHMGELRRLKSGGFGIEQAYTLGKLEALKEAGELGTALVPIDTVFSDYAELIVSMDEEFKVRNGAQIKIDAENGARYRVYGENGDFLCLSEAKDGRLKMLTSFW